MKTTPMNDLYLIKLGGLCALALGASLVGLFFDKNGTEFRVAMQTMLGGFFFGSAVAFLIHDADWNKQLTRIIVFVTAMFARPLYFKLKSKVPVWLDSYVSGKIKQKTGEQPQPPISEPQNDDLL